MTVRHPENRSEFAVADWEQMKKDGKNPVLNHVCWYTFINDVRGLLHGPIGQWDKFLHGVRFFATAA